MIVAGTLGGDKGEPVPFMPDSKIRGLLQQSLLEYP